MSAETIRNTPANRDELHYVQNVYKPLDNQSPTTIYRSMGRLSPRGMLELPTDQFRKLSHAVCGGRP